MAMRTVFVSTPSYNRPGGAHYLDLYENAIKKINVHRLATEVFWDLPPAGIFSDVLLRRITRSNLVVAVIAKDTPNVMIEVGMALGAGKPIIPLLDQSDHPPSLIAQWDYVRYDPANPDYGKLAEDLSRRAWSIVYGQYDPVRQMNSERLFEPYDSEHLELNDSSTNKDELARALDNYGKANFEAVIDQLAPNYSSPQGPDTPFSARFAFLLSDAYFLQGERLLEGIEKQQLYSNQLDVCRAWKHLFPTHRDLYKNYGLALLKLGDSNIGYLVLAENIFRELIDKYPLYDVARYNLACIHARKRDVFNAIKELALVFASEPRYRDIARYDADFDTIWDKGIFQRLVYPPPD